MYDYLLVLGPGRSGSDFLYRTLRAHPEYVFPRIKEGGYYRSLRAFRRALGKVRLSGRLLCDIANDAYRDARLVPGVRALQAAGHSVLLMILLRDHHDRAVSMMRFRKSRGRPSALFGTRRLEDAVVRDRLSPARVQEIFGMSTDILCVDFEGLVADPTQIAATLSSLCGTAEFAPIDSQPANVSVRARFVWLSSVGWLGAVVLRAMRLHRTLQRIKGSARIARFFFRPLPTDTPDDIRLSKTSEEKLNDAHRQCWSVIKRHADELAPGVYLRRTAR